MSWIYLMFASICEICWIFSIKYLKWGDLLKIDYLHIHKVPHDLSTSLLAFCGYIAFGLGNIILFSLSMKTIPASTAYAAWMAMALIGSKIVDLSVFKEPFSYTQIIFLLLILIGVVGLKYTSEYK